MRALVTGRYGFTGRYVAKALSEEGWDVWGACSAADQIQDPRDRAADLTDAGAVAQMIDEIKPDAVVHLAGIAFVAHGSFEDFYRINLIGTRNLLQALRDAGCGRRGVILASSANIYGNAKHNPIPESAPPAPESDYAVSKCAMEYAARLFFRDLPITITRPFNYTGRGQDKKFLVPKIIEHFSARAPQIELGNLDVARDFSDVRDVAAAYAGLLRAQQTAGEAINICSGRAIALGDIIDLCEDLTGHKIEVVVNPAFKRAGEIKLLCGDPSRLKAALGGVERHRFEDTLKWMLLGAD